MSFAIDENRKATQLVSIIEAVNKLISAGYIIANKDDYEFIGNMNMEFLMDNSNNWILGGMLDTIDFYNMVFYNKTK